MSTHSQSGSESLLLILERAIAAGAAGPELTPHGAAVLRAMLHTAAEHVPIVMIAGGALDETATAQASAIDAMMRAAAAVPPADDFAAAFRADHPADCQEADREQANYLLGLLVGAELLSMGGE